MIANEHESTPPPQSRRPGGYGGFADDGLDMDPMSPYPPTSPKKQAPSLLSRMDSLAPGPFESNRRPAASRQDSYDEDRGNYPRSGYGERPGTSSSMRSNGMGGMAPPRAPRNNGYGGFGPPQRQDDFEPRPIAATGRAGTFPKPSPSYEAPLRTPSAPGPRPDRFQQPPKDMSNRFSPMEERRPSMGPDTSRPPPPRTSLIRTPTSSRSGTGSVDIANEFGIGNPYHTPSDSMSSTYSKISEPSSMSSSEYPPRSESRRKPSDMSNFDNLMSDLQMMDEKKVLPSPPMPQQQQQPPPPINKSESLRTRRQPPRIDPRIEPTQQEVSRTWPRSPLASPFVHSPRSDSLGGRRPQWPQQNPSSTSSPERRPASRGRDAALPAPPRRICKACNDPISGKSVSSADGRLTGRYHKACFVCTTCTRPFDSTTFYVHGDKPYCGHHYHEINGSLCGTCNDGIEGQYLADETDRKYHPVCFVCADPQCGAILDDGYFEVEGKQYCEKDAMRRMQMQQQSQFSMGRQPPAPRAAAGGLPRGGRAPMGLPSGPTASGFGPGPGTRGRLAPGGLAPKPKMEKRMTRLGMFM